MTSTHKKWPKLGEILDRLKTDDYSDGYLGEFFIKKNEPYELIDATPFLFYKHIGNQKNVVHLPRIVLKDRSEAQSRVCYYYKHHSGRITKIDERDIFKHYRMIDGAVEKIQDLLDYNGVPYPSAAQVQRRSIRHKDIARRREEEYLFTRWQYGRLTEFRSLIETKDGAWMYHSLDGPAIIKTHDGKKHFDCIEIGWHRYHHQHRSYDEPAHIYLHEGLTVREEYRTNGLLHRTCGPAYITRDVFHVNGIWGVQGEKLNGFVPGPDFDKDQNDRDNTIVAYIKANPQHIKRMLMLCEHNKWLSQQAMDSLLAAAMFMK